MSDEKKLRRHIERTCGCSHPSLKCLVCSKAQDNIVNEYNAEIAILRNAISAEMYEKLYVDGDMAFLVQERIEKHDHTKHSRAFSFSSLWKRS